MTINSHLILKYIILLAVFTELTNYSLRFIRLENEDIFHIDNSISSQISNKGWLDKINSYNGGTGGYGLNSGILINTENVNGYNPIFPKRLLWAINAISGREADFVESVSLNLTVSDNDILKIAGANTIVEPQGVVSEQVAPDNVFSSIKIVEDIELYRLITENSVKINSDVIFIKYSDKSFVADQTLPKCEPRPKVTLVNRLPSISLQVKSTCNFYFVAPIVFDSGWRAYIKNKSTAPFPAFGFLQGYRMPAGDYLVSLDYKPPFYRRLFDYLNYIR